MKNLAKSILTIVISFNFFSNSFAEYEKKIVSNDLVADDFLGQDVDISGDYAIVGAPNDDDGFLSSGSAYIFKRSGTAWVQQAKLTASDAAQGVNFGKAVAISGDYAVVGSNSSFIAGSANVFVRTGNSWTEQAKISGLDPTANNEFGSFVEIDGDYIIVGAPRAEHGGIQNTGAVYIFHRSGTSWNQQNKLVGSGSGSNDGFGYSVSISGDKAIVGANGTNNAGIAYIFERNGSSWTQQTALIPNDTHSNAFFGQGVGIYENYAVIGAPFHNGTESASGSAYVYKFSGGFWTQEAQLFASDIGANEFFGWSVDINGTDLFISCLNENDGSFSQIGSAYHFAEEGNNWVQQAKFKADDGASGDNFGFQIAASSSFAIVGAYQNDGVATDGGAAYIYSINPFGNGDVTKAISGDVDVSFDEGSGDNTTPNEDTGIDISFTGVSNSASVQCESFPEAPTGTNGISGTVQEVRWVITNSGLNFANAEIKIDMTTLPIEMNNPNTAIIYHRSTPGSGTFSALATTVDGNNLVANTPSFSEFAIGGGDSPLAVELSSFSARQIGSSIQLNWSTASETENEGFNVYRKLGNEDFVKIASHKSHTELKGQGNTSLETFYTFNDNSKLQNGEFYTYLISDVETNGIETKHEESAQSVLFEVQSQEVRKFELKQNYPNPFNPSTTISYNLAKDSKVSLKIYNEIGEFVKELTNGFRYEGSHNVIWDGTNNNGKSVSSGIYFYKISAGTFTQTNKMILLK
ncbi:MAG: T9SS C-terminal target domain-containing protein [Calditrichaeota bacterium]|nr:MAG: T9SS C-terminal target domain-containing protein [Calditrichota bacterium]